MELTGKGKQCSFCGTAWTPGARFMGGHGAFICDECATRAARLLADDQSFATSVRAPWQSMTPEELLATLPDIVANADQVEEFLHEWVGMLRDAGVSWQKIGLALGVSRQAAWERFTRVKRTLPVRAGRS